MRIPVNRYYVFSNHQVLVHIDNINICYKSMDISRNFTTRFRAHSTHRRVKVTSMKFKQKYITILL